MKPHRTDALCISLLFFIVFLSSCLPDDALPSFNPTGSAADPAAAQQAAFTETPSAILETTPIENAGSRSAKPPSTAPPDYPAITATAIIQIETLRSPLPTREDTLTAEEALRASQTRNISPDGMYGIACGGSPSAVLFNNQAGAIIAQDTTFTFLNCNQNTFWVADGSYAFTYGPDGTVARWYTADGHIENFEVQVPQGPNASCNGQAAISPDLQYLAVYKECGVYAISLPDRTSFDHPLVIIKPFVGDIYDIRWVTPYLFLMQREHGFSFHQVPSGKEITNLVQGGSSGCFSQLPFLSPDGRWMVSETLRCDASLVSYIFTNVEQGTQQIFAKSSVDQIDFVGWKADSSAFYLISRPLKLRAQAAQRTPFGLLELNPLTGQFRRLSDQVWFAAFPRDQNRQFTPFDSTNPNLKQAWLDSFPRDVTRAFFAFPVKSTDGSMHLEGGLWQMGSGKMGSSQVLSHTIPENLSIIDPQNDAGWMLEDSGEEIGYSAQVVHPPLPGVWSNDGQRLATINENHELVILNKDGSVQTVGRATTNPEESNWTFRGIISWSDDDHDITVAEEEWPVP